MASLILALRVPSWTTPYPPMRCSFNSRHRTMTWRRIHWENDHETTLEIHPYFADDRDSSWELREGCWRRIASTHMEALEPGGASPPLRPRTQIDRDPAHTDPLYSQDHRERSELTDRKSPAARAEIRQVLTPEQQARFDAWEDRRKPSAKSERNRKLNDPELFRGSGPSSVDLPGRPRPRLNPSPGEMAARRC